MNKPIVSILAGLCVVGLLAAGHAAAAADQTSAQRVQSATGFAARGMHRKAAIGFEQALAKEPGNLEASLGLAESYLVLGRTKKAESTARDVLATRPMNSRALLVIGRIELARENYATARRYLLQSVAADGKNAAAFLSLGQVLGLLGEDEAADAAFGAYAALTSR